MNVVSKWKQGPDTPKPARSLLADPERVFIFDCVRYRHRSTKMITR
jgi:hypothetical protein